MTDIVTEARERPEALTAALRRLREAVEDGRTESRARIAELEKALLRIADISDGDFDGLASDIARSEIRTALLDALGPGPQREAATPPGPHSEECPDFPPGTMLRHHVDGTHSIAPAEPSREAEGREKDG